MAWIQDEKTSIPLELSPSLGTNNLTSNVSNFVSYTSLRLKISSKTLWFGRTRKIEDTKIRQRQAAVGPHKRSAVPADTLERQTRMFRTEQARIDTRVVLLRKILSGCP